MRAPGINAAKPLFFVERIKIDVGVTISADRDPAS